ncbi:hypothetical protein ACRWY5_26740, partial [Escherichia coli]
PLTDFGGKTSIFSHPVYLFLREFSLQDFRGGSGILDDYKTGVITQIQAVGRIGNVFSALESGDSKKVVHLLTEGRKLLRTG